ncbi:HNH endonuclease [Brachybacterium sp. AOP3-A1-3]|uniref:HNH endonuclease n=1 Tax=Brachybacterium sp. AOP3-A1-3 TaxID=3457699 RepID=UPI004033DE56
MSATNSTIGDAESSSNHPWSIDAVRAGGMDALAQLLGDVGFLLEALAKDPGDLFETQGMARGGITHLMVSEQVIRGAQDALEARTVVALAEVTRRDRLAEARDEAAQEDAAVRSSTLLDKQADGRTRRDLSLITRCSPSAAGSSLASARRLVASMPNMLTAMAERKVSSRAAYAVAGSVSVLDGAQCREVDAILGERLPSLDGAGVRRWRDEAAAAMMDLDAEGALLRHRRARKGRAVTIIPGDHGMADLHAHLPAIDARLLHKRLSLEAERRRAEGGDVGHGALMADALVDTVLGRDGAMEQVELDLGVIITDRALFRPDAGDPAHIEGYGPVPPEAVREQLRAAVAPRRAEPGAEHDGPDPYGEDGPATRATIRRLFTHPTTGELVAVESRGRAFPPALEKFLTWRDTSCRGPFCNAQSRQNDHIRPYAQGGPTSLDNGQDACLHCNQKENDALAVECVDDLENAGHRVAWTGHSGVTRVTAPTPLSRPPRPSPAGDQPPGPAGAAGPDESAPGNADPNALAQEPPAGIERGSAAADPEGARRRDRGTDP